MRPSIHTKAIKSLLLCWRCGTVIAICATCACGGEQQGPPSGIAAAVTNSTIRLAGVSVPSAESTNGIGLPTLGAQVASDTALVPDTNDLPIQGSLFPPPETTDIGVTIEGAIADGTNLVEDINIQNPPTGSLFLGTSVIPNVATGSQGQSPAAGTFVFLAPTEQTATAALSRLPTTDFSYVTAQQVAINVYASTSFTATTPPVKTILKNFTTPDVVYPTTNYGSYAGTHQFAVRSGVFDVIIRYLDIIPANGSTPSSTNVLGSVVYAANINAVNGVVTLSGGLTNGNTQSTLSVNVSDKPRGSK